MVIESKGKAIEILIKTLPYPNQITNIDVDEDEYVRFNWRQYEYGLSLATGGVSCLEGSCHINNDTSILMEALIKKEIYG